MRFKILEEVVKESQLAEYEAVTREFIALLTENELTSPSFQFTTLVLNGGTYVYVTPIENYAALDAMAAEWHEAERQVGSKWQQLMARGATAVEYAKQWVVEERTDLSYGGSNNADRPGNLFRHYDFYLLQVGKEPEAEEIALAWRHLCERKEIRASYSVFRARMGWELPLYIVERSARDEAEFAQLRQHVREAAGEEGRSLQGRLRALVRRFEHKDGILRPDLSYLPTSKQPL